MFELLDDVFLQFGECLDLHARALAPFTFLLSIFLCSFGRIPPGLLPVSLQFSRDGTGRDSEYLGYFFLLVSPDVQGLDAVSVVFG